MHIVILVKGYYIFYNACGNPKAFIGSLPTKFDSGSFISNSVTFFERVAVVEAPDLIN